MADLDKGGRPTVNGNLSKTTTGLSDYGITRDESSTFQRIASLPLRY